MEGAFNDASFALMRGASEPEAMAAIDRVLAQYGSLGAMSRANQLSNWFIENELTQLQTMGFIIPAIFLGVSAFLLNIVLTRLIAVQREQIAALKALGYTNREIAVHYVSWAVAIALTGAVLGGARRHLARKLDDDALQRFLPLPDAQIRASRRPPSSRARSSVCLAGATRRDWRRDARGAASTCRSHAAGAARATRHRWLDRLVPRRLAPPP